MDPGGPQFVSLNEQDNACRGHDEKLASEEVEKMLMTVDVLERM